MTRDHQVRMARLALLSQRVAELDAQRAEATHEIATIYRAMAEGQTVELRSGRRHQRAHVPKRKEISETDRARADVALREREIQRRVGR